MRRFLLVFFFLVFSLIGLGVFGQVYQSYEPSTHTLSSENVGELNCQLYLPISLRRSSGEAKFPLIILFDQQNQSTFHHLLQSINFITSPGGQMPDCIVAGVPFTIENRLFLTDSDPGPDGAAPGIESTDKMLFDELIPSLRDRFPGISDLILIGHSRTGWLVNYLLAQHPEEIALAVSCSGFYESEEVFRKILSINRTPRDRELHYYMFAGTSWEETTYLPEFDRMRDSLSSVPVNPNFTWRYELNGAANHITNYGLSAARALTMYYSGFTELLGEWFDVHLKECPPEKALERYKQHLAALPYAIHIPVGHAYSIASDYYNREFYDVAAQFLEEGLKVLPNDAELSLFYAECLKLAGREAEFKRELERCLALIDAKFGWDEEQLEDLVWMWNELRGEEQGQ